jgi:hypothetical protein
MNRFVNILICLFTFALRPLSAQNLVVNGDFETYTLCNTDSVLPKAEAWYTPNCGTPDYFHALVNGNTLCTAQYPALWGGGNYANAWGYQTPFDGLGYAGFVVANGGEFMAGRLSDTLRAGRSYEVSFFTSLCDNYFNQGAQGLDLIQVSFNADSITDYNSATCWYYISTLSSDAGNWNGNYLTDTSGWMLVRDTFTAVGGERYFVVGNIDTASTLYYNSSTPTFCYYYFDDFDVHCIDCTSDTSEPPVYPQITITPTLTQGELVLSGNFPVGAKFEVYDVLGQLVFYDELQIGNQNQSIFLPLGAGVYTCRVMAEGSLLKAEKVVVVK